MTACASHPPTDLGNARRFVKQHGAGLRYVPAWGWLVWDGRRWTHDETGEVMRRAKEIPDLIRVEALKGPPGAALRKTLLQWALKSESRARLEAMIALAQTELAIAVPASAFDADPRLLNVANGTLDLRSGALRPHRREDLITKLAPVEFDPATEYPRFLAFLDRIMAGNEDLIRFLQRAIGSALTGIIGDQKFYVWHGFGANGKSTLQTVLRRMLGDYAAHADATTFLAGNAAVGPRPDLTRLVGVRLLFVSEVGVGRQLDEALVKAITGGDPLTVRTHHRESFEFVPVFKPFLACNHEPVIRDASHGVWRRIVKVPFGVTIPSEEQDPHLAEELFKGRSGILNWLIEGCLAWQREGLGAPPDVIDATAAYREQSDALAGFLGERCGVDMSTSCAASDLYRAYRQWAEDAGERPVSRRRFEQMLAERGFKLDRSGRLKVWAGLVLRGDTPDASPSPVRYAVPFSPSRGNGNGTPIQEADIPEIARRLGRSG